jgi:type II secretion system protein G
MPSIRMSHTVRSTRGFTLIELLIVIAIILILISIALPNFLEAQVRAKVARAKGEIRSLSTAMQSYFLDFNIYPCETEADMYSTKWNRNSRGHLWLTSPIKYISDVPADPFASMAHTDTQTIGGARIQTYETGGIEPSIVYHPMGKKCSKCMLTWAMWSKGPSSELQWGQVVSGDNAHMGDGRDIRNYSPTNGTASRGSILTWGGDPLWIGYPKESADVRDVQTIARSPVFVDGEYYSKRLPPTLR